MRDFHFEKGLEREKGLRGFGVHFIGFFSNLPCVLRLPNLGFLLQKEKDPMGNLW